MAEGWMNATTVKNLKRWCCKLCLFFYVRGTFWNRIA